MKKRGPSPAPPRRCGGTAVTSLPWKNTLPEVGRTNPVIRLISVLFPEPFGPITPSACPGISSRETSQTASIRPNALLSRSTRRIGSPATVRLLDRDDSLELPPLARDKAEEPLGQADGEHEQQHPADHHPQRA